MRRHFHFLTQRVLPLVYDDSLSYYEILCKMQHQLIELGEELDEHMVDFIKEALPDLIADATYDDTTGTLEFTLLDDPSEEQILDDPVKRISVNGISRPVMDEIARTWAERAQASAESAREYADKWEAESWLSGKKICFYGDSTTVVAETYTTKIRDAEICDSVTIRGVSGHTLVGQGLPIIQAATDLGTFDYVFICYGINDYAGTARWRFIDAVRTAAETVLQAGSEPVFVFPWEVYINTFHSNGFISDHGCDMASYVDGAIDVCDQLNIKYFNLHQISGVNRTNYRTKLTPSSNGYYLHESDALGELVAKQILNGNYNTGKCYDGRFERPFTNLLPLNWGYLGYSDMKALIGSSPLPFRRGKALSVFYGRICEFHTISCGNHVKVSGYCQCQDTTGYVTFYFYDMYNQTAGYQQICRVKNGSDFSFVFTPSYQGGSWRLCAQTSAQHALIMNLTVAGSNGSSRLTSDTPSEPMIRATFDSDVVEVTRGGYLNATDERTNLTAFAVKMLITAPAGQTTVIGNVNFYPQRPVYAVALNGANVFICRIGETGEIEFYSPPAAVAQGTHVFVTETDLTPNQFLLSLT